MKERETLRERRMQRTRDKERGVKGNGDGEVEGMLSVRRRMKVRKMREC